MAFTITSVMLTPVCSCQQTQRDNPLLQKSTLPFGAPDFNKIQYSDYLPAFEAAIKETQDNIQKIVENTDSPTFENTILPYEESGRTLDRVSRVFFALASADKTPEISEMEKKVTAMMTELNNEIMFNKPLFNRIRQVYDNEYKNLEGEEKKLLEEIGVTKEVVFAGMGFKIEIWAEDARKAALISNEEFESIAEGLSK